MSHQKVKRRALDQFAGLPIAAFSAVVVEMLKRTKGAQKASCNGDVSVASSSAMLGLSGVEPRAQAVKRESNLGSVEKSSEFALAVSGTGLTSPCKQSMNHEC